MNKRRHGLINGECTGTEGAVNGRGANNSLVPARNSTPGFDRSRRFWLYCNCARFGGFMKRINVDNAAPAVKEFLRRLPLSANGVELELGGRIIGKLIPPSELSQGEKAALMARGKELVQRARQRNRGVSARALQREVDDAVNEVRRRQRQ